ncbi:hypothetical protein [Bryobacter aggregatus]|uniref:hypothetical protein n=1 Tax=Bryobacter aggregatus TaxID=360054 RepID=UPI0004E1F28B|nr:hypothetical protein [Bryobacter aggregatus]
MNTRRLICTLLGAWLGASLFMAFVAAYNFRVVNDLFVLPQPEMASYIKVIGQDRLQILFRHEAAEFNRSLFEVWGIVQIVIALLLFGILLFGTKEGKFTLAVSLTMVLLVTGMHLLVTPSIIGYGRSLDFIAKDKELGLRQKVKVFHNTYSTLEGIKMVGGVILLVIFFRETRRRPERGGPETDLEAIEAA